MVTDLFGAPLLPGLELGGEVLTHNEERDLICRINAADLAPFQFQQWTGKRLTRSFGWSYDFQNGGLAPTDPIPDWLDPLKQRAAQFAGLGPHELVQALVIRYDPGATIGWHKDRPVFEHIVGISLGEPAIMRFRRRTDAGFERRKVALAPRSIYHLSGEARKGWEHSIAELSGARWSVTFRSRRTPA